MTPTQTLALMIARDAYLEDGNIPRFRAALEAGGIENGPSGEPGILMHDLLEWQLLFENRDADRTRRVIADVERKAEAEYAANCKIKDEAAVAFLKARQA